MANKSDSMAARSAENIFGKFPKIRSLFQLPFVFDTNAAGPTLGPGYPVGVNSSTGNYGAWMAPDPTVLVVSLVSSSAGTFTITVNGVVTATIAYDATAAEVEAALLTIGYSASVDLTAEVHTVSFDADGQVAVLPTVTGDVTSITGGSPTAVATAGTATLGLDKITGFVWFEDIVLDDTDTVQGVVIIKGELSFDEIEALVDVGDVAACRAACKVIAQNGLIVRDIGNIV